MSSIEHITNRCGYTLYRNVILRRMTVRVEVTLGYGKGGVRSSTPHYSQSSSLHCILTLYRNVILRRMVVRRQITLGQMGLTHRHPTGGQTQTTIRSVCPDVIILQRYTLAIARQWLIALPVYLSTYSHLTSLRTLVRVYSSILMLSNLIAIRSQVPAHHARLLTAQTTSIHIG